MTLFFLKKTNTLIKKYKNIIKCDNNFLIFFLVNPSIILFYFILTYLTPQLYLLFYFFFTFYLIHPFLPHSHQTPFFFSSTHHLVSFTHLKDSFSSFTQKTRRERYITHTHTHTQRREEESTAKEEEEEEEEGRSSEFMLELKIAHLI